MSVIEPVGTLYEVGIDVEDLDRSAAFWIALLGLRVQSRTDAYLTFEKQSGRPIMYLQKVPESKASKTRIHLDIAVKHLETAVARSEALGATRVRPLEEEGERWVVMEDPDANEFCLVEVLAQTA